MTAWRMVCGTGHRELDPQVYGEDIWRWVSGELQRITFKLRDEHRTTGVISGMARGFDLELFDVAGATPGLAVHACVPFPQQADRWPVAQRRRWRAAIDRAASVHFVGDLAPVPAARRSAVANRLLYERNDEMLLAAAGASGAVVVLYDQARNHNSGTHDAFEKALGNRRVRGCRLCLPIVYLDPVARNVRMIVSHMPGNQRPAA
jgi:hypothetical protein